MGRAQDLKDRLETERRGTPFFVYRDSGDEQRIQELGTSGARLTVGRDEATDFRLDWDKRVSALHAELECVAGEWMVIDDNLSRNGTYVNGERVQGRQRLRDGDVLLFGQTLITFHDPRMADRPETVVAGEVLAPASLSAAQRRVLVSLCRPLKGSHSYASPATNKQIAAELYLSGDAIKTHLRALYAKFGIEDLPQNQKRLRLAEIAFQTGLISDRDL